MSYALSAPSATRRSGLLMVVVGLHAAVIAVVIAAKTVVPQIMEMPLIVDLVQPAEIKPPEAKPLPVTKPQPVFQKPQPRPTPTPVIEATQSQVATANAPDASPPDVKPAPPAPPAEAPVVQARFDADYLKNPAPPYPPLSRRMGEEGKVILRVSVNPQGGADQVEIRSSSGSQRLDESAVNTVKHWKFIPAKRGDSAIQSWVLVPIVFKLEQ
ncbi:energy transducer TonB [Dechloromonas sp.]|uniref:energy transducer TonB n=1 Tax=Dechloromonas sp. TaxID=1917218 RepID=UPI00121DC52E|nr:energy transducer TonB [Dechloromonas sp.]MBU3697177.1 energy transducer TonB [Dechloromonas sp.]TEX44234.1 MAG: energy transducer TonB [Rhodocyclaceae bacterium]